MVDGFLVLKDFYGSQKGHTHTYTYSEIKNIFLCIFYRLIFLFVFQSFKNVRFKYSLFLKKIRLNHMIYS